MSAILQIPFNDLSRTNAVLAPALREAVSTVISSGRYVLGGQVDQFEKTFAEYSGVHHCVSVANGTDAIELTLRALDIGPGMRVGTVANAGMYSTTAILATGAQPVYIDVCPQSCLMDVSAAQEMMDCGAFDAIIVTHLYGRMADIEPLSQSASRLGIPLIEDCAQAHGCVQQGRKAGTIGEAGCFSFYPTKNLGALGDGGAVITDDPQLAERVRMLRQYGWSTKYCSTLQGGRNSRMDEMQAAVLLVKLPWLDAWNAQRRSIASAYSQGLRNGKVACPQVTGMDYVAHLYVIRVQERDALKTHLTEAGIGTDIHYPRPDYHQQALRHLFPGVSKPHTEAACAEVLSLPCFPGMTEEEICAIIDCINGW
jgi:dTDP-3-amino-2,3,6-trideoxy-4-keto-D-glucose/dTDP-3-amino-3,4,6-trideoxy-alpha-D-glucose/dTDP-2,6-dideoxy-D-kanosamine transaminase